VSTWTVIGGALSAGLLAWAAIAAVAWLGEGQLDVAPIRWFGAGALGLVALDVAGVPVHWGLPPALVGVGLAVGVASASAGEAEEAA
jgi:hypothetical protein